MWWYTIVLYKPVQAIYINYINVNIKNSPVLFQHHELLRTITYLIHRVLKPVIKCEHYIAVTIIQCDKTEKIRNKYM